MRLFVAGATGFIDPGAIETDFSGGKVRDNPEIDKQVAAMTALGRVGLPGDVGPMIAALLSDDNSTGSVSRSQAGCRSEGLYECLRSIQNRSNCEVGIH